MEFYLKALELTKNFRYFKKWEGILPIVKQNDESYIVTLYLAESMVKGQGYFMEAKFDKNSGKVLNFHDGFHMNWNG